MRLKGILQEKSCSTISNDLSSIATWIRIRLILGRNISNLATMADSISLRGVFLRQAMLVYDCPVRSSGFRFDG
jgi:hypothetical protein